jgi:hypothetical protein
MKLRLFLMAMLCFTLACKSSKNISQSSKESKPASGDYKFELVDEITFKLTEIATDKSYGFDAKNPVKVGFGGFSDGPKNERRFLNALAGPKGETITYKRLNSCCPFETPNGLAGGGLLDVYEIKWEGLAKPITLYLNMYDPGELKAPLGLTIKKN